MNGKGTQGKNNGIRGVKSVEKKNNSLFNLDIDHLPREDGERDGSSVGKVGNESKLIEEGGGVDGHGDVHKRKIINCNHEEVSKMVEELSLNPDSKIRSTNYGSTIVEL